MQPTPWLQRRGKLEASFRAIIKAGTPTAEQLTQAITEVIPHAFRAPAAPAEKASGDDAAMEDAREAEQAKEDAKANWMLVEHCLFRVVESHLREGLQRPGGMTDEQYGFLAHILEATAWVSQQKPLQLNQLAEPFTTISALDQIVEGCCLADLDRVFAWIEGHREVLEKELARGRLMLLRACNNLLSRISKSQHTVLCGRVSMFLSMLFPLHERSAMNLSAAVNASHRADLDEQETVAANLPEEREDGVTVKFYEQLWSLQTHFYSPALVLQNAVWERFSSTAAAVLSVFESSPLADADVSPSEPVGVAANGYGTKYLTSSKLTHLEVHDAAFRRHVLLQMRFLLQFLQLPNSSGQSAQRLVAVAGAQLQAVKDLEERVMQCFRATPPSAAEFAAAVENAIVRERAWLAWKVTQCKDFSKPPVPPPSAPAPGAAAGARPGRGVIRKRPGQDKELRVRLGHQELDRLFNLFADAEACAGSDRGPPDYEDFLSAVREQADPAYCAEMELDDECKRKNDKVYHWRALRLCMRNDYTAFGKSSLFDIEEVVKYKYNINNYRVERDAEEAKKPKATVAGAKKEAAGGAAVKAEAGGADGAAQAAGGAAGGEDGATAMEQDGEGGAVDGAGAGGEGGAAVEAAAVSDAAAAADDGAAVKQEEAAAGDS